jgi:hypothetical protein
MSIDWIGWSTERQESWRARSNEAPDENDVVIFAYRIMLNVRGLRGNQDDK